MEPSTRVARFQTICCSWTGKGISSDSASSSREQLRHWLPAWVRRTTALDPCSTLERNSMMNQSTADASDGATAPRSGRLVGEVPASMGRGRHRRDRVDDFGGWGVRGVLRSAGVGERFVGREPVRAALVATGVQLGRARHQYRETHVVVTAGSQCERVCREARTDRRSRCRCGLPSVPGRQGGRHDRLPQELPGLILAAAPPPGRDRRTDAEHAALGATGRRSTAARQSHARQHERSFRRLIEHQQRAHTADPGNPPSQLLGDEELQVLGVP